MNEVLTLEKLWCGYDGVPAVRDLTMHVNQGEVVALLGPNGAGKTTTARTISGLLSPIKGDIHFRGDSLRGLRPNKIASKGIGHVLENRGLFSQLSVAENLRMGAWKGKSDSLPNVLQHFPELGQIMNRKAGLLSGGEQQMLALARALATSPELLIVDEMSLGLAPIVVQRVLPVLRSIAQESGCAVLVIEQHVSMALEVSDRAYVLVHGQLIREGTAKEFLDDPDILRSTYMGDAALEPANTAP